MSNNLSCPVDLVTVHDKQPRIVAGFVALLLVVFIWTKAWWIVAFLALDFFFRSFKRAPYSVLGLVSKQLVRQLKIPGKPVDVAPKRFAAKLGLAFSLLTLLVYWFVSISFASYIAGLLLVFALLESVLGYCVGCKFFQVLRNIGWVK